MTFKLYFLTSFVPQIRRIAIAAVPNATKADIKQAAIKTKNNVISYQLDF